MAYFPMYIELKDKPCLVVGGGKVAWRKVKVLMDFGAKVTVVAKHLEEDIAAIKGIEKKERPFLEQDLLLQELVVAATDDHDENAKIANLCRRRKIPVNAVDQVEDCDFIFPSYVKEGKVVAAFTSGGQSPVVTQYLKRETRPLVTTFLGELTEYLGSLRDRVKQVVPTEQMRKKVYEEVLNLGMELGRIPDEDEVNKIIEKY